MIRPYPLVGIVGPRSVGWPQNLDSCPFPGPGDHEAVVALPGDVRGGEVVQLPGLTPNPVQRLPVGVGVAGNDYGGAGVAGEQARGPRPAFVSNSSRRIIRDNGLCATSRPPGKSLEVGMLGGFDPTGAGSSYTVLIRRAPWSYLVLLPVS